MSTPQNCCCQCLCPHSETQPPPTSAGHPPILAGRSGPVPYGVTAFFPKSWCARDPVCTLQECSLHFPQSCGIPVIKPYWPSKPDSLRAPPPIARPPGWEAWCGAQKFHSSGRVSVVQFLSSPWVAHPVGMGFDFITVAPLIPSRCGFYFVFGYRVFFFW